MKIIIPNLPIAIMHDIIQCLESVKHILHIEPLFWSVEHKPIIDMFDEIKPSIVFIHESQLDQAFEIVCQEFNFNYVLVTNNPIPSHVSKPPSLILTHTNSRTPFEQPVINIRPMARVAQIHNSKIQQKMASEVLVNTTNVEITSDILNLLLYLANQYKTKIIGNQPVKLHHYLGDVTMFERADFIKSAKAVIDLNQLDFWDAAYLMVPSICLYPIHPVAITFNNITSLKNNLDSILTNDLIRTKYIQDCYAEVYNNNTCYHYTAAIFTALSQTNMAEKLVQYVEGLKK